jgi:hemolysin III
VLVLLAEKGSGRLGAGIFAFALSALLGTSALYHRINWKRASTQAWMRRLDHTMIFVLIAGTFTPFAMLGLEERRNRVLLYIVWGAVLAGMLIKLMWLKAPRWVTAGTYVAVGCVGCLSFPEVMEQVGGLCVGLIAVGGALYIAGAFIYALKRPNPWPATFGYHEIFHALVILGATLHYSAVALAVLPGSVV